MKHYTLNIPAFEDKKEIKDEVEAKSREQAYAMFMWRKPLELLIYDGLFVNKCITEEEVDGEKIL